MVSPVPGAGHIFGVDEARFQGTARATRCIAPSRICHTLCCSPDQNPPQ